VSGNFEVGSGSKSVYTIYNLQDPFKIYCSMYIVFLEILAFSTVSKFPLESRICDNVQSSSDSSSSLHIIFGTGFRRRQRGVRFLEILAFSTISKFPLTKL
jgi:hypothetical protein